MRVELLVTLFCAVLAAAGLAGIAHSLAFQSGHPAMTDRVDVRQINPTLADRSSCAEIGLTDLRSPPEGLWFQSNCSPTVSTPLNHVSTSCNRTSPDDSFTPIAP